MYISKDTLIKVYSDEKDSQWDKDYVNTAKLRTILNKFVSDNIGSMTERDYVMTTETLNFLERDLRPSTREELIDNIIYSYLYWIN